jgi:hypothetical protein
MGGERKLRTALGAHVPELDASELQGRLDLPGETKAWLRRIETRSDSWGPVFEPRHKPCETQAG